MARGLAVLGMFGAHLLRTEPLVWSDPGSWSGLVDGRSSILFAVLAGVSVGLLTGRGTPPTGQALVRARVVLLTRAALVLAIGSLMQLLVVPVAVILEFYAVLFVLCVPLLRWTPRQLFALAAGLVVVVNPLFHLVLLPVVLAETAGGGVLGELGVTGVYPVVVWSTFVVAGLGLGRLDLTAVRVRVQVLVTGLVLAVVGYTAGSVVGVAPFDPDATGRSLSVAVSEGAGWRELVPPLGQLLWTQPHSDTPAEVVGSGGFALLVLGACLLLADRLRWVLVPLAAVGSMPLTAYCVQLLGIAVIADTVRAPGGGPGHWLLFSVLALVGCTLWTRLLGRGPLERLVGGVARRAAGGTPDRS